ncbi:MAG: 3-deoxy-manno-octulosonate cytidylyltransferase [Bacteroidaceae bacterium]|nr:3-deoxy-manno-octulosonate cytidylyltransferase [Bacteroidaceae bacterium]MBR2862165.1 3-deoxy-manno-octulosonate cytidylyltransferase [Bacteroidaceae bacterium]
MKFIAIIPARYASTRFPGKPLVDLGGKPIIQWVYERVSKIFEDTFVATDDQRIFDTVIGFGGKVIMTKPTHPSGTDRCYEAYLNSGIKADVVVNVQGDEPFIDASQLECIKDCFADASIHIATLVKPFKDTEPIETLENPNTPKVVIDSNHNALYFSRSVIPYLRGIEKTEWPKVHTYYKHIGLYAYRTDVLAEITQLPQGVLEKAESLEQLRWLQAGYKIKTGVTTIETIGIDTPEDLQKAEALLLSK